MSLPWFKARRRASKLGNNGGSSSARVRRRAELDALEERTLLSGITLNFNSWTPIGPAPILSGQIPGGGPVAGRVTGIAPDPQIPTTMYISSAGGGVWKTIDGGLSWKPLTDHVTDSNGNAVPEATGAVAIAQSNLVNAAGNRILYAGMGEANNSGDSEYGKGIEVSLDGGASWTLYDDNGAFDGLTVAKLAVDPTDPTGQTVYAAFDNLGVNGVFGTTGVYKTTDAGKTWTNTTASIATQSEYSDVVVNPSNSKIVYAAIGSVFADPNNGIYESTDAGATWKKLGGGAPSGNTNGRISIALAASSPSTLYASVANPATQGLKEVDLTTDGGATWTNVTNSAPNALGGQGLYDNVIAVDPTNPAVVFVAGQLASVNANGDFVGGIIESTDSGKTWKDIEIDSAGNGPHVDFHAAGFDAAGNLIIGSDGGVWQLINPADLKLQLWKDLNSNLNITEFTNAALDPSNPNVVYGGSQDNGAEKFTGALGWNQIALGDGGFMRVDASNPQTIYHEYYSISLERSDDGGQTFTPIAPPGASPNNANFYVPYVLNPSNTSEILYGTDTLYESTDKGVTWTTVGTPKTAFNAADAPIDAIAATGTGANTTIYVTAGGSVYVSTNNGTTWTQHNVTGANDIFSDIAIDPTDPQTAYIVRNAFNGSGEKGHVFRTTNGGLQWTDISGTLPDVPANAVALNVTPLATQIWVGTDTGVYTSTDLGKNWALYGTGLPNAQVVSLEFNSNLNILLAGTHGRGAWEIQGRPLVAVTPLPTQPVAFEGVSQDYNALVTFNDSGSNDDVTNYVATIDWGDGTTTLGSISGLGPFTVSGTHTYADEGTSKVTVTVTDTDGATTGLASETVAIADAPITLLPSATSLVATEGTAFNGSVATFTDLNPGNHAADFTATITWGNGAVTPGTVVYDPKTGVYSVNGTQSYRRAGTYPVSVNVVDVGGQSALVQEPITVTDAPLIGSPLTLAAIEGTAFSGRAATFTDGNPFGQLSDFSAKIDWGDGTTTAGVVRNLPNSVFSVSGTHAYVEQGSYPVSVQVTDVGGTVLKIASTANIADAALTPSAATLGTVEGQALPANSLVATFNDANTAAPITDFSATIDWGNGVSSVGTITNLGNGRFGVTGGTLYPESGNYTVTVTVHDRGGSSITAISSATIADAPLSWTGTSLQGTEGKKIPTSTVAMFNDADVYSKGSDFTATIDWGDGTTDTGTIVDLSGGVYGITGTHTYVSAQSYTVIVNVNDRSGQNATVLSTAVIGDAQLAIGAAQTLTPVVGQNFSGVAGTFTDPNPTAQPSDFIASIDWGDGTVTAGTVAIMNTATPSVAQAGGTTSGGPVTFTVSSGTPHAYHNVTPAGQPSYAVTIQVVDLGGSRFTSSAVANVADAPITGMGASTIQTVEGQTYSGPVSQFTDGNLFAQPSDFTATIDWGDGNVSTGNIALDATDPKNPIFTVNGRNQFAEDGQYDVRVTVRDRAGQTNSDAVTPAKIADAPLRPGTVQSVAPVAGHSFTGVVAAFTDTYSGAPFGDYTATINWGDGSPVIQGNAVISQPGGPGTPLFVSGTHTYANPSAALPIAVTVTDSGGATVSLGATAHVQVALTGTAAPGSVSGGFTRNRQETFSGHVEPGATVELLADGANVGATTADTRGNWTITSRALADGRYTFSAAVLGATNNTIVQTVQLSAPVTIDTTGPSVAGVTLDAGAQVLHVTFQDIGSGLNMAGVTYLGNYQLATGGTTFHPTGLTVTPGALGSGEVTANVSFNLGRVRPGGYVVTIMGNFITDLAGNMLVERTFVTFPQTTNSPNPNYVALINVSPNLTTSPPQVYIPPPEQAAANQFASRVHPRVRFSGFRITTTPQVTSRPVVPTVHSRFALRRHR